MTAALTRHRARNHELNYRKTYTVQWPDPTCTMMSSQMMKHGCATQIEQGVPNERLALWFTAMTIDMAGLDQEEGRYPGKATDLDGLLRWLKE